MELEIIETRTVIAGEQEVQEHVYNQPIVVVGIDSQVVSLEEYTTPPPAPIVEEVAAD